MGILDYIKNILFSNKKNAQIYAKTLKKEYGESEPLEIGLYDGKTPIPNEDIGIEDIGIDNNHEKKEISFILRINKNITNISGMFWDCDTLFSIRDQINNSISSEP